MRTQLRCIFWITVESSLLRHSNLEDNQPTWSAGGFQHSPPMAPQRSQFDPPAHESNAAVDYGHAEPASDAASAEWSWSAVNYQAAAASSANAAQFDTASQSSAQAASASSAVDSHAFAASSVEPLPVSAAPPLAPLFVLSHDAGQPNVAEVFTARKRKPAEAPKMRRVSRKRPAEEPLEAQRPAKRARRKKRKPCKFFAKGDCRDGDACLYSHSAGAASQSPQSADASPEQQPMDYDDESDDNEMRDVDDNEGSEAAAGPPRICKFFEETGKCFKGPDCDFLHVCRFFATNSCRKGDSCAFAHVHKPSDGQPKLQQKGKRGGSKKPRNRRRSKKRSTGQPGSR